MIEPEIPEAEAEHLRRILEYTESTRHEKDNSQELSEDEFQALQREQDAGEWPRKLKAVKEREANSVGIEVTKILLVDDSVVMLTKMENLLTRKNPERVVDCACNTAQAMDLIGLVGTYDLMTLDINMPGELGDAFYHRLHKSGYPGAVMIVSTEQETSKITALLSAGVNHYCIKPFTDETFLSRADRVLKKVGKGLV